MKTKFKSNKYKRPIIVKNYGLKILFFDYYPSNFISS